MNNRALHISSINREKIGQNKPEDFIVKFSPPIYLSEEKKCGIALDRFSMTFSWHNVNSTYGNNQIKYSNDNGSTWETISFVDGMYSYDDLNDYIQSALSQNGDDKERINLIFVLPSYRVIVEFKKNWQLDLRNSKFSDPIGFNEKIIKSTEYSVRLPNIINSIDALKIGCSLISDSYSDGKRSETLALIPTDNLTRSYSFNFEPKRAIFSPTDAKIINEVNINLKDNIGRPVVLKNIDWFMTLIYVKNNM